MERRERKERWAYRDWLSASLSASLSACISVCLAECLSEWHTECASRSALSDRRSIAHKPVLDAFAVHTVDATVGAVVSAIVCVCDGIPGILYGLPVECYSVLSAERSGGVCGVRSTDCADQFAYVQSKHTMLNADSLHCRLSARCRIV